MGHSTDTAFALVDRSASALRQWLLPGLVLLHACPGLAQPTPAVPVVINSSQSARPGDIVGFQGENLGSDPSATLESATGGPPIALERVNAFGGIWASFRLPNTASGALVLRLGNSAGFGRPIKLNGALPYHLDALQLAGLGKFRVFGRSLLAPGFVPTVTVDGRLAEIDLAASDENDARGNRFRAGCSPRQRSPSR